VDRFSSLYLARARHWLNLPTAYWHELGFAYLHASGREPFWNPSVSGLLKARSPDSAFRHWKDVSLHRTLL
jgi:hypothetical protein